MSEQPVTTFEVDQHRVGYAVHHLMRSAKDVFDLAEDRYVGPLMKLEYDDLQITHKLLGIILQRLKP